MLLYLGLSFFVVNFIHSYLLVTHRSNRDLTISERAVSNSLTIRLYVAAHIIGGFSFLLFAQELYLSKFMHVSLFVVVIVGVIAEYLQALIPARDRYERFHLRLAYFMSIVMTFLGAMSALLLPLEFATKVALLCITALILLGYPLAILLPRRFFWTIEMININLFYLQMVILAVA